MRGPIRTYEDAMTSMIQKKFRNDPVYERNWRKQIDIINPTERKSIDTRGKWIPISGEKLIQLEVETRRKTVNLQLKRDNTTQLMKVEREKRVRVVGVNHTRQPVCSSIGNTRNMDSRNDNRMRDAKIP